MPKKIGHTLEQYLATLTDEDLAQAIQFVKKKQTFRRTNLSKYTYTICCPLCDRFFEFNLEVEK